MRNAVDRISERLLRAAAARDAVNIAYAVVGGNAIAARVSRVDESAVRNTQDVDILLRRDTLEAATQALQAVRFIYRHVASMDMFLDGPDAKARDALRVVFARERVRPEYLFAAPDVDDSERAVGFQLLALDALVRMKLTSFRDKDRVHLRDLIGVGLVGHDWIPRLPVPLRDRLEAVLDDPDG